LALKEQLKEIDLQAGSFLLKEMRVIKDEKEIEALQKAAHLTWRGIQWIKGLLKEGITEEELAFEFEFFVRKNGASGLSFDPIIAFGENSAYPHYRAGQNQLKKNQIVLMDVGAIVGQYRGDLTRVVFFGEPDPQLQKMLEWTRQAGTQAIHAARVGAHFGQLDQVARSVFAKHGVEEWFAHGLGHGIGLETHEFPNIREAGPDKDVLIEAGMVFTIEPGLYRPGLGGVRWEEMVLVTRGGAEKLGVGANE
jgi:Xaa-Pro aminopeptidase